MKHDPLPHAFLRKAAEGLCLFLLTASLAGSAGELFLDKAPEPIRSTLGTGFFLPISYWITQNSQSIRVDLVIPELEEAPHHMPLVWDYGLRLYKADRRQRETQIFLYWMKPGKPDFIDCWIWRSDRTAPAGVADDFNIRKLADAPGYRVGQDAGSPVWTVRNPAGVYEGDTLPRYRLSVPEGSTADVRATSEHQDGLLRITLERSCKTGFPDDLDLSTPPFLLYISETPLDFSKGLPAVPFEMVGGES